MSEQQRYMNSYIGSSRYPVWVTDEDHPKVYNPKDSYPNSYKKRIDAQKKEPVKKVVKKIFQYKFKEVFWDFLNLVFSNDDDTKDFWSNILRPIVLKDFGYDLSNRFPVPISHGFLIHSIKYHWRINFNIQQEYKLFSPMPFGENSIKMIQCTNSKIYNLKNIAYHKIVGQVHDYIREKKHEHAINCLEIQESVINASKDFEYTPPCAHELSQILADKAQIYLKMFARSGNKKLLDLVEDLVQESMHYIPHFHAEIIKLSGVYQTLQQLKRSEKMKEHILQEQEITRKILQYHLGSRHPLQSFLLCFQANQSLDKIRPCNIQATQKIVEDLKIKKVNQDQKKTNDRQIKQMQDKLLNWKESLLKCSNKFLQAIDISKIILGGFHIKIAEFYQDMAVVYIEMNEMQSALDYMEQAKKIIEYADGNNSIALAHIHLQIALVQISIGDNMKAFSYALNACEKYKRNQKLFFKECVYAQFVTCLSIINYESPNIDTLNSIAYYIEDLWGFVKQSEIFETSFSESDVAFIYQFCFMAVLDIEIKLLDTEYKTLFFKIVIEQNKLAQEEDEDDDNSSNPYGIRSKYTSFFQQLLRNSDIKDEILWENSVKQYADENNIHPFKLMNREFYPSQREMQPGLSFKKSPFTDREKIELFKQIAFGQANQSDLSGSGVEQTQLQQQQAKFVSQEMKASLQLNQLIKSIFDDIQKKMTHIKRMSGSEQYNSYVKDLISKFEESESYIHLITLMKCLGYDYFYYSFKNSFKFTFNMEDLKKRK